MIEAAYWIDSRQNIQRDITPFSYNPIVHIQPDGSFYFEDQTDICSISTFRGIITFLSGAETMLFSDRSYPWQIQAPQ
jgi:hypothetical protein